ncbi:MAG: 3-isopropylmalate dehydratase small subunit [Candidatus Thorarchaeota archaeon]|nr:3-isopropylmalate dehydratase small subunit [Candidatus Thorarchaeota archaeon]
MVGQIRGRAWLFDDNVDTDQIISGKHLRLLDYAEMAKHALEIPRPDFAKEVRAGDVIVAGRNFGSGSSREEAPQVLKQLGVSCVVAESFARIFYRNSFNIGLPAIVLKDATLQIRDGEDLAIDLEEGRITVIDRGAQLQIDPIPPFMMALLKAGGAVAKYKNEH